MRRVIFSLAVLTLPVALHAGERAKTGNYPERAAAWKRFSVRDVQLGAEIDKLRGFVCDASAGEYRHTCVQFIDDKCKGKPTYVKSISVSTDVPRGQGCTYDTSTGGTYLDGQLTPVPMAAIAAVGTDTYVPRAYEIRFTFAKDLVTEESNIGKATIAKYGKPDNKLPPISMRWEGGISDLYLLLSCAASEGAHGQFCSIQAYDGGLLEAERSVKKAYDTDKALRNAPAAPRL